jgi:hypothetical protein
MFHEATSGSCGNQEQHSYLAFYFQLTKALFSKTQ